MKKVLSLVLLLVFAFQAFLFPSACPSAQAEVTLPYYNPVELRNPDVAPIDLKAKTPYKPHAEGWLPERSGYLDGTISVRIDSRIINNTIVWFTWVQVADPTQIRTTSWRKYPSKKEVFVTAMAEREHSVLAINGDFCVDRSQGVVIRNGETLRRAKSEDWDCMFIDGNGDFHIRRTPVPDNFDDFDGEIMHSFVFGPGLVIDGILQTEFGELTMRLIGGNKKAQRTVFCQMDTLSYLIITTEGPEQSKGGGFTIDEVARLAYDMGVQQAFNIDGGSSAWLVLGEKRINAKKGKKRTITDAILFITAEEKYSLGDGD